MSRLRQVLATAVVTAVVGGWPSTALASCVPDDRPLRAQVADAETVFVGTVVGIGNRQRDVRLRVHEVWRGDVDIDADVSVLPAALNPNVITSVDRTWRIGTRYLVFAHVDRRGRLRDDACSPTRKWRAALEAVRPDDAIVHETPSPEPPAEAVPEVDGPAMLLIGGVVLGVLAVAATVIVVRRSGRRA